MQSTVEGQRWKIDDIKSAIFWSYSSATPWPDSHLVSPVYPVPSIVYCL